MADVSSECARGRHVVTLATVNAIDVAGDADLALGVTEYGGLGFFESGDVAQAVAVESAMRGSDVGGQRGYTVNVYADGSTTTMAFDGAKSADDDADRTAFSGTWHFVAGTGRFVGIEGSGEYAGRGFGNHAYSDFTGKASLPVSE